MRYYRKLSLWHGLLTCSFMFLELIADFLMAAMCCYQTQTDSVAVVTSPSKEGCVVVAEGKSNQKDACMEVCTKGCSKENTFVL